MFDRIAERYDLLNRVLSLGIDQRWRKKTVAALELHSGDRILDLATGTADLAIQIARTEETVRVVGVDPSERMMTIGRDKIVEAGLHDRIELVAGDAQQLPFEDRSFDGVCIAFGIRNVPDRLRALREMARVTKPGRAVAILELSEPRRGVLGPFARFHMKTLVPWVGALVSGAHEYRYLERSIAAFPPAAEFVDLMTEAGLVDATATSLTFGVCHLYVGRSRMVA
jgi:demethylmenaquinone methyltransferase/2-methoxy-6-polyprenyl-1,4-benzoquinol methylase